MLLAGTVSLNAQNVGIGTNTPTGKTHVVQTAAVDVILVDHNGGGENSLQINQLNPANANAAAFIINNGVSNAALLQVLNNTSISSVVRSQNLGEGNGVLVEQLNTGAAGAGLFVDQDGTGPFSRGVDVTMDAANGAIGYSIFHNGTGRGLYMDLSNAANASIGYDLRHAGTGRGSYMELSNAANASTGAAIIHDGTGRGMDISLNNLTSTGLGFGLFHDGLGRGGNISLSNAANTDMGWGVFHSGTGIGLYSQTVGDAVYGFVTGDKGTGGSFVVNSTTADRDAIGAIVIYNGTGTAGGGGGNAVEIQHNGTNGNGVDVFMGDPSIAAGPANTTSEYAAMSVSHMATGTAATAGLNKTAITATNNSADPSVLVFNNGTDDGDGMNVFITPATPPPAPTLPQLASNNQAAAIYAQAADATGGEGIGVFGFGGDVGVAGATNGGVGYGLYSFTNFAAAGAKSFHIDYPLDPANKTLRHFCIESDEILNMYRGVVELDANGQATIELPEYFEAVNINPSYQLTAIGTPKQPYVLEEIEGNTFKVAGAPNTKVSWTVHAERNDPTIQYFNEKNNFSENIQDKKPHQVGLYITPEAYGKDEMYGVGYRGASLKTYKERKTTMELQQAKKGQTKAVTPTSATPAKVEKASTERPSTKNEQTADELTSK